MVRARGVSFAVYRTPEVTGSMPLLCVNGGLLYSHSLLWPALSPIAQRRQLVLYDQRGRGESEAPPDPRSARIEHDADDVVAIRQALGLGGWDVLGHSWGGGIAMLAAERDRAAVRRLVLVAPVGPTSSWMGDIHARALERLAPADRAALQRLDPAGLSRPDPAVHSAYARALYPAWFADPGLAQLFAAPRSESRTGAAIAARLHREGYDWTRLICAISAGTLVVHGERDLHLCATSHELSALVPHARLELIPECGHMPFWEEPGTFFKILDSFLAAP